MAAPASYREFLRAFRQNWLVAMGGAVSVIATVLSAIIPNIQNPMLVGASAIVCGFLAAFAVWAGERTHRVDAESRFSLSLAIEDIATVDLPAGASSQRTLMLFVTVRNPGEPTVLAKWRTYLEGGGERVELQPVLHRGEIGSGLDGTYGPEHNLVTRTATSPIPKGGMATGLLLSFMDAHASALFDGGATISVACADVADYEHVASAGEVTGKREDARAYALLNPNSPSDDPTRPRVKLTTKFTVRSNSYITHFEAENFGQSVAVNVAATIRIPHTNRVIKFQLAELPKDRPVTFMPELFDGEKAVAGRILFPLEEFMKDARLEWYVGRACEAVERLKSGTSDDPEADAKLDMDAAVVSAGEKIGTPLGNPLSVSFTVEYSNFDRTCRWASSHILTYASTSMPIIGDPRPPINIYLAPEADTKV